MELLGVKIRVHPTFIWLLLIVLVMGGWGSLAWVVMVFTFVVLHELSHSLVAKAHGIPVRCITLLPIGGIAQLGAMPEDSATEFNISIAGPALNFVIAGAAYMAMILAGRFVGTAIAQLLHMVLIINLALGTFNLLPGFPMDGGRLLRAYLARKRGYLEATHIAAQVGRWIAGGLALLGFASMFRGDWNGLFLVFIAVFIYVSGKQEEMAVAARHATQGVWQLFGYGGPEYDNETGNGGAPPHEGCDSPGTRGDVIDVKGTVRGKSDSAAADAFRKLAKKIDSHVKR